MRGTYREGYPKAERHIIMKCLNGRIIEFGNDGDIVDFKYIEDMNLGFPIIEMTVSELVFKNLN